MGPVGVSLLPEKKGRPSNRSPGEQRLFSEGYENAESNLRTVEAYRGFNDDFQHYLQRMSTVGSEKHGCVSG